MSKGKKFEALFVKSCAEQGIDTTRLKDAGWQGEKTIRRFTVKNICDFVLFNGQSLYFLELKYRSKSLRFDEITQREALKKKENSFSVDVTPFASCGVVVCLSGRVFYIHVHFLDELEFITGKKSFNAKDCESLSEEHPAFCREFRLEVPAGKRAERIMIELN